MDFPVDVDWTGKHWNGPGRFTWSFHLDVRTVRLISRAQIFSPLGEVYLIHRILIAREGKIVY